MTLEMLFLLRRCRRWTGSSHYHADCTLPGLPEDGEVSRLFRAPRCSYFRPPLFCSYTRCFAPCCLHSGEAASCGGEPSIRWATCEGEQGSEGSGAAHGRRLRACRGPQYAHGARQSIAPLGGPVAARDCSGQASRSASRGLTADSRCPFGSVVSCARHRGSTAGMRTLERDRSRAGGEQPAAECFSAGRYAPVAGASSCSGCCSEPRPPERW